jgi:mannose-6-phosphate isomerase-like protein (cupin superfamily)
MAFVGNIETLTVENENFRKVLYTTPSKRQQLVVMSLDPQQDIGMEVHDHVDQFIKIEQGHGKAILDGQTYAIKGGYSVLIPAGTQHNIINTSKTKSMKLYTLYSPANHPPGRLQKTKPKDDQEEITPSPEL